MVDPGDGTIISATNISIVTYAGDGQWSRQEDIYNPLRFVQAAVKWCKKAEKLGTLDDDAARWLRHIRRCAVSAPKLVIGANGFLGSHVTRQLVADRRRRARDGARGRQHPQHRRPERHPLPRRRLRHRHRARGDGRLRPGVLLRGRHPGLAAGPGTAVPHQRRGTAQRAGSLRKIAGLQRFVFTSTYATVDRRHGHIATEADRIGNRRVSPYVQSRVQAEDLVMRYVADHGLPAVAMCVSTTYGSGDWGRTPHGAFIAGAVYGKLPFLMNGIQLEVVGVDDAARAMILAAERGRDGEKYLISERMMPLKDVVRIAADEAGVPAPRRAISVPVLYALGALGSLRAKLTGKDAELSLESVRMMRAEAPVDHSKAMRELGWQPRPDRGVDPRGRAVLGHPEERQARQEGRSGRLRTAASSPACLM